MEVPTSFKEAVAHISYKLCPSFTFIPSPLPVISQNYKTSECIAQHEGIPHSVGNLFILQREHEMLLSAGIGGESSQEKTSNDGAHTVSASYGGHACERTFSVSTSHSLSPSSCAKLYYTKTSRGDSFCSLHACHKFSEEFLLSSSYAEGLCSDPTLDIEFQQEKKYYKVTGKLVKNLLSSLHHLHIQSSAALPAELTLKNSISTDSEGNGYSGLEFGWASSDSCWLSSALLGMDGHREITLRGSQTFWETTQAELSAFTNFSRNTLSFKLEHKDSKENRLSMDVTSNCSSIQEVRIMTSFAEQRRSWKWKFRKMDDDGYSLGLEWKLRRDSDSICSLSIEAGHRMVSVNGELCHSF